MTSAHDTITTEAQTDSTTREQPIVRSHSTYEQPHWHTAHIERVDRIGAFESHPFGDGPIKSREVLRVDIDGYGHGGASMHDAGENLQASFWLTPETARDLRDDLNELLAEAPRLLEEAGGDPAAEVDR